MFNIEISPAVITKDEARGLVALLMAVHGDDIVPASFAQVGEVARATGPVNICITPTVTGETKNALVETAAAVAQALAPDGYPVNALPADKAIEGSGEVERDKDGIPWDERIHASTKTKTQAGIWTRRRNLEDAIFDAVMAELRAANTTRTMEAAQALADPTAAEAFTPPASVVIPPAPPTAAAVPTPPPAPAPAPSGEAPTFVEIMKKVTSGQSAGKITQPVLQENLAAVGLDGIAKLATADAGTRAAFAALIDAALA